MKRIPGREYVEGSCDARFREKLRRVAELQELSEEEVTSRALEEWFARWERISGVKLETGSMGVDPRKREQTPRTG
jgi:hypothetical protein